MPQLEFEIAGRKIGYDYPPLVIVEIGINHGGNIDVACKMADEAKAAGAEIIKHQTHILSDEMSSHATDIVPANANKSIWEVMNENHLSLSDEAKFIQHVKSLDMIFISTPFSRAAANWLNDQEVPAFKIGSGEIDNLPLVRYVARFGKPMIMSTGMQDLDSVMPAVEIVRSENVPFALLHCTNLYPTPPSDIRLGGITQLAEHFTDAVIGYSDHSIGIEPCLGAVALGASIIERHFTDTMTREGPDIVCSMDPAELRQLIKGCNILFQARGGLKSRTKEEEQTYRFARASVVTIKPIKTGETFSSENIWVKRPGTGDIAAKDYDSILGSQASNDLPLDHQLTWADIV